MTLDEMLKQSAAWLDSAERQSFFDKVDEKQIAFGDELRAARATGIAAAIDALEKRRDETVALYEAAIAGYKAELDGLKSAPPRTAGNPTVAAAPTESVDEDLTLVKRKPAPRKRDR